jgi:hypothetical protein
VWNRQHLEAAYQGLVVGEDGEIPSCGDSTDEHVDGTALDAPVKAEVEEVGSFDVIGRQHVFVEEWREKPLDLQELRFVSNARQNLLANDPNHENATLSNRLLEFHNQALLVGVQCGPGSASKG